jgi:hypothetical protein
MKKIPVLFLMIIICIVKGGGEQGATPGQQNPAPAESYHPELLKCVEGLDSLFCSRYTQSRLLQTEKCRRGANTLCFLQNSFDKLSDESKRNIIGCLRENGWNTEICGPNKGRCYCFLTINFATTILTKENGKADTLLLIHYDVDRRQQLYFGNNRTENYLLNGANCKLHITKQLLTESPM